MMQGLRDALSIRINKITGRRHSRESLGLYTVLESYQAINADELTVAKGERVCTIDLQTPASKYSAGIEEQWCMVKVLDLEGFRRQGLIPVSILHGREPSPDDMEPLVRTRASSLDSNSTGISYGLSRKRHAIKRRQGSSNKDGENNNDCSPNHNLCYNTSCSTEDEETIIEQQEEVEVVEVSTERIETSEIIQELPTEETSSTNNQQDEMESVTDAHEPLSPQVTPEELESYRQKRLYVLEELYNTEKQYVEDLRVVVEVMMEELSNMTLPEDLVGKERIVFGNIRAIYNFHKDKFLPDIEACHEDAQDIGKAFVKYEKQLRLYITYCENKPRSEYLVSEFTDFFSQELAPRVNCKLQVQDLLIKPVQRIMKYHLLLKDVLKQTQRCCEQTNTLEKAMEVMKAIPKAANNMMEVGRIQGFEVRLAAHGTVLLQDTLPIAEVHLNKSERKYKPRRVFLFEQVIVFTELSNHPLTGHYYKYKSSIKLTDMALIEKVFDDDVSFILTNASDSEVDTYIQLPDMETKQEWVSEIMRLLQKQQRFLHELVDPLAHMRLDKNVSLSNPDVSKLSASVKHSSSLNSITRNKKTIKKTKERYAGVFDSS